MLYVLHVKQTIYYLYKNEGKRNDKTKTNLSLNGRLNVLSL